MDLKVDSISYRSLVKIETSLDVLLKSFKPDGISATWYSVNRERQEGRYLLSYTKNKNFLKGDFEAISEGVYRGRISLNLSPELEDLVLQNLSKFVPSLAKQKRAKSA